MSPMRCDTCGKDVPEVKRVLVDTGYDRTLSKALYNCTDCYAKKEASKKAQS
jgi:DNA-directed RNA polymerase subunit RPC12/RpoP